MLIKELEQWFADQLAAMQHNEANLFNKADTWKHQVAADAGGLNAFQRNTPFAYVSYNSGDSGREGDNELRRVIEIKILIGCYHDKPSIARIGDDTNIGCLDILDLVIAEFENKHPGAEFNCDEIYYTKDIVTVDTPKHFAVEVSFETSKMHGE